MNRYGIVIYNQLKFSWCIIPVQTLESLLIRETKNDPNRIVKYVQRIGLYFVQLLTVRYCFVFSAD